MFLLNSLCVLASFVLVGQYLAMVVKLFILTGDVSYKSKREVLLALIPFIWVPRTVKYIARRIKELK
jgi:hypothetical protein